MRDRLSFRARVMLLGTGMGLLLSLVFAAAAVLITERYEHVLVGALLQDQADALAQRLAENPQAQLASSARQRAHLRPLGRSGNVPAHLAALTPGVHEAEGDSDGLHIGVFDTPAGRIYLEVDLRDIEALEGYLLRILLLVIVAGALFSALLGWGLSRRATRPLRRLADAVDQLGTTPQATDLAASQPRDELGRVARAVDGYQRRLLEAEAAERAFFADASHELRTPVAVVRGALELLEDDALAQPRLHGPMQRLRRGVDETSALLDALLRLARHQLAPIEMVETAAWVRSSLATALRGRVQPVTVRIEGDAVPIPLAVGDADLVMAGLLRPLLATPQAGTLVVRLAPYGLEMHFRADGDAPAAATRNSRTVLRSDRALGSSLIGRLAAAHGWQIDLHDADHGVLRIRWAGG